MSIVKSVFIVILGVFGVVATSLADVAAANSTSGLASMLPMIMILIVFMYLMVIRPQSKRVKAHRALMNSLQIGDEVIIGGGIFGKISKLTDESVILEIANNVEIKVQRAAIVTNLPKGTVQAA